MCVRRSADEAARAVNEQKRRKPPDPARPARQVAFDSWAANQEEIKRGPVTTNAGVTCVDADPADIFSAPIVAGALALAVARDMNIHHGWDPGCAQGPH